MSEPAPKIPLATWLSAAAAAVALAVTALGLLVRPAPAPPAPPAAPGITLPAAVEARPGRLVAVRATLTGAACGKTVRWYSDAVDFVPADLLKDSTTALAYAPLAPGRYRIHAHAAAGNEPLERACCTLVVSGPAPPVPPGPTPPVPPGPTPPGTKALWVVVVSDKTQPVPDLAAVLNAPTLRKALTDAGHTFRWYDQRQDAVSKGNLAKFVTQAGGVPALVLMEKGGAEDGKVAAAVRLPGTEAGILDAIRKAGGK